MMIPGGTFMMGAGDGEDYSPAHEVALAAFTIDLCEVTNAQYEAFDPTHRALRGKLGFSSGDDDCDH